MDKKKQVALIILDGWGYRTEKEYNAIIEAETPFFDRLWSSYPHALLEASGEAVGLPAGQIGTSEVGHATIGAGRAIDTHLVRVAKAGRNGEFSTNQAFVDLFNHVKKYDSTLHVQGLIGPGGVHSSEEHLYDFLKTAKAAGLKKIAIHAFTDGRDTPPQSSAEFLKKLEEILESLGVGFIATCMGRYYAMDRDHNWDRLEVATSAMYDGQAKNFCSNKKPSEILSKLYQENILDEFLEPIIFLDENNNCCRIQENDGIFFFNFRADRARMLTKMNLQKSEKNNLFFVTLTEYDRDLHSVVAFPPIKIETNLAEQISLANLTQAHIAETEKFVFATYYFNGSRELPYKNEKDIIIQSRQDVKTHDQAPEMRAKEIADAAIEEIKNGTNFLIINFANADIIGHTANREALIQAVESVDFQADRIVDEIIKNGGTAVMTADHGNAEVYYDIVTDTKHTAHTLSLVPFILTEKNLKIKESGTLADVAPTILEILDLKKPEFMTGQSLIQK
ncbi:MAG: 2,3-bisphosphoglycerate-independent phosphoglycerate mutase [Candidatus Buchananbacteria bacterium]